MPRPSKKFKSLDEEEVILPQVEETPDDTVIETEDVVTPDDELTAEKDEFSVSGDDDAKQLSISSIHINQPPPKLWSDGIKLKYNIGVLVCLKGSQNVYKVVGPAKQEFSYNLKASGSDAILPDIKEKDIKFAPEGSVWKSIWDVVPDPYRDWKLRQEQAKLPVVVEKPKRKYTKRKKSKK
jgi:hypothetical protein